MTTRQFGRRVEVSLDGPFGPALINKPRIEFDLVFEATPTPPESTVRIFNVSDETDRFFVEEGTRLQIFGGYQARFGPLMSGFVRRVDRRAEGLNRIVELTIGPGKPTTTLDMYHQYYGALVPLKLVVADAAAFLGVIIHNPEVIPNVEIQDLSFTGRVENLLKRQLEQHRITFHIHDDRLYLVKEDETEVPRRLLVSERTGMIGTPGSTEKGVEVSMLLDHRVRIDQVLDLESSLLSGFYKIIRVAHAGDNWDGEFRTDVEAITHTIRIDPSALGDDRDVDI